jgi:septal ring factor EnvC (AmiA/AmiB activator)
LRKATASADLLNPSLLSCVTRNDSLTAVAVVSALSPMPHDIRKLIARLRAQQRELEAVLQDTPDDEAHHLQHALECVAAAIANLQESFPVPASDEQ